MKKGFTSIVMLFSIALSGFAQEGVAKYVFFFIGDGMGMNQVSGAEIYLAQKAGENGSKSLLFTQFPYLGLAKTYSYSHPITDSAAGGTALASGIKTKNGTIGMDHTHILRVETIAERAKKAGRRVGIATSVSVDHATPASFYAHQPSRRMTYEIGTDLTGSGFDFFAGSDFLTPENAKEKAAPNLFKLFNKAGYTVARGVDAYKKLSPKAEKIILLQEEGKDINSIPFAIDWKEGDLTLPFMTESAIQFLNRDHKGFFVMIEGGKIDWSSHSNDVGTTFEEVIDLDRAVQLAYQFYLSKPDSTLIVVTADHETGGLGLGTDGYVLNYDKLRNQKLSQFELSKALASLNEANNNETSWEQFSAFLKENLGFWDTVLLSELQIALLQTEFEKWMSGADERTKSMYAEDAKLAQLAIQLLNTQVRAGWTSDTHTAAYVPIFAIGVGAEQFMGIQENTDVPKKIEKAAGY